MGNDRRVLKPCTDVSSAQDHELLEELLEELFSRFDTACLIGVRRSRGEVGTSSRDRCLRWKGDDFAVLGLLSYSIGMVEEDVTKRDEGA